MTDTKHAITLVGPGEIEMLIHIGLDTVELAGRCFSPKVKDGDAVKAGELLGLQMASCLVSITRIMRVLISTTPSGRISH